MLPWLYRPLLLTARGQPACPSTSGGVRGVPQVARGGGGGEAFETCDGEGGGEMAVHGPGAAVGRVEGAREGGEEAEDGSGEDRDAVDVQGACGAIRVVEGECRQAEKSRRHLGPDLAALDAQEDG